MLKAIFFELRQLQLEKREIFALNLTHFALKLRALGLDHLVGQVSGLAQEKI